MNARLGTAITLTLGFAGLCVAGAVVASASTSARTSPGPHASVAHGRYLVRAGDCMACHTASNACAGQNACKGQGYVLLPKAECEKAQSENKKT